MTVSDDLRALRGSARMIGVRTTSEDASVVGGGDEGPLVFSFSFFSLPGENLDPIPKRLLGGNSGVVYLFKRFSRVWFWGCLLRGPTDCSSYTS